MEDEKIKAKWRALCGGERRGISRTAVTYIAKKLCTGLAVDGSCGLLSSLGVCKAQSVWFVLLSSSSVLHAGLHRSAEPWTPSHKESVAPGRAQVRVCEYVPLKSRVQGAPRCAPGSHTSRCTSTRHLLMWRSQPPHQLMSQDGVIVADQSRCEDKRLNEYKLFSSRPPLFFSLANSDM